MDIERQREKANGEKRERQDGDIAKNEEKGEIVLPCRWGGMKEREKEGERKIAVETKGARENNVLDAGGKEGTSKWN